MLNDYNLLFTRTRVPEVIVPQDSAQCPRLAKSIKLSCREFKN